jgi:hypothetical protein
MGHIFLQNRKKIKNWYLGNSYISSGRWYTPLVTGKRAESRQVDFALQQTLWAPTGRAPLPLSVLFARAYCRSATMAFRRMVCVSRSHVGTRWRQCPCRMRCHGGWWDHMSARGAATLDERTTELWLCLLVSGFMERRVCDVSGAAAPQLRGRVWHRNSLLRSDGIWIVYDIVTPCLSFSTPYLFGLSTTSQQYFSLRRNQPPAKVTGWETVRSITQQIKVKPCWISVTHALASKIVQRYVICDRQTGDKLIQVPSSHHPRTKVNWN